MDKWFILVKSISIFRVRRLNVSTKVKEQGKMNATHLKNESSGIGIVSRLYQYYRLSASFLFAALLARWLVLLPLVGTKFLPGGIHEYLCYLILYASFGELFCLFGFHGLFGALTSSTLLKNLNMLYFVAVMHFYDDYEHAPVLKNSSYSSFIIGLSFTQMYCHWKKLFKHTHGRKNSIWRKVDTLAMMPLFYLSEFYLLLLNVQNPNFHSTLPLDRLNKFVLVVFIPLSLHMFKKQISSL